jgi:hypothetical protein
MMSKEKFTTSEPFGHRALAIFRFYEKPIYTNYSIIPLSISLRA